MRKILFFMVAALVLCQSVADAEVRITSADFSLGYGWTDASKEPGVWDPHWCRNENTETTLGDFSFTPAATGRRWGPYGVMFNHRILQDGTNSATVCMLDYTTKPNGEFEVPITASFNGTAPIGDSYALELEITSISIYGCTFTPYWDPADGTPTLNWDEVTPGHEATSLSVDLLLPEFGTSPPGYDDWQYTYSENYTQLIWDPDDYAVPLASPNDPVTRTFDILRLFPDVNDRRFVDGLEIEGRVHLVVEVEHLPGDANGDGMVTDADAAILATNWQQSGGWGQGDFNGDGMMTDADAAILATHWQEGVAESAATVPEPAMSVLLLAVVGGLLIRFAGNRLARRVKPG